MTAAEAALVTSLIESTSSLRDNGIVTVHLAITSKKVEVDIFRDGFDTHRNTQTQVDNGAVLCRTHG